MSAVMDKVEYRLRGIPADMVPFFWHYAEPYIKRALDHANDEFTPDQLRALCEARTAQLWLISRGNLVVGAATTEIVRYPNKTHCRIWTLAGKDFNEWVDMADAAIREWAAGQGCDALESIVRRGFIPQLKALGYRWRQAVMVKPLGKEEGS